MSVQDDVARPGAGDEPDGAAAARAVTTGVPGSTRGLDRVRAVLGAYAALTKPRIIELLLISTVPVMFLAAHGVPPLVLVAHTMIAGYLAAGSANVINCVIDRDIDERMRRTRRRPLPRHSVSPRAALIFGVALGVASFAWFCLFVNLLSAVLALAANLVYVFGYSLLLKRRTSQNIVWGGLAGCFPPLIGWTAVTGSLSWVPLVMFGVIFFWTPPHTWALAFRYREDYERAGVPMLPVVMEAPKVAVRILSYSVATVACSLLLWPLAPTAWLYPIVAIAGGAFLIVEAVQLLRRARVGVGDALLKPMRLFHASNLYLALIFVAAAVDTLLPR